MRCWPHHFDIATLITLERDAAGTATKTVGVGVAPSGHAHSLTEAWSIVKETGFPAIIRPSFTLGGTGGSIAGNEDRPIDGGGHTWPGGDSYLVERIVGKVTCDWDSSLICEFPSQFDRTRRLRSRTIAANREREITVGDFLLFLHIVAAGSWLGASVTQLVVTPALQRTGGALESAAALTRKAARWQQLGCDRRFASEPLSTHQPQSCC